MADLRPSYQVSGFHAPEVVVVKCWLVVAYSRGTETLAFAPVHYDT